jgi:hypothetical protein
MRVTIAPNNYAKKTDVFVASASACQRSKDRSNYQGDGVDDHVQIQAAINSLEEGETLTLSEGLFNVGTPTTGNNSINIPENNLKIQGLGKYVTKLKLQDDTPYNVIGGTGVNGITIQDLELDGNEVNNDPFVETGDGILNGICLRDDSNKNLIQRVYSHDNCFHGIAMYTDCDENIVKNNELSHNRYRAFHTHDSCNYNIAHQNLCKENAYYYYTNPMSNAFGGIFIVYNDNNYNVVSENVIIDDYRCGINIAGRSSVPEEAYGECKGNKIINNTIVSSKPDTYGIFWSSAEHLLDTIISGNQIKVVGDSSYGIYGFSGSSPSNMIISNNTIEAGGRAMRILGANKLQIVNNPLLKSTGAYACLYLKEFNNCYVKGNIIEPEASKSGIAIELFSNSKIKDNMIGSTSADIIQQVDAPVNCVIEDNMEMT